MLHTLMMMNRQFELLGELTQIASLQLTRSYYGVGDFQLEVSCGAVGAELLEQGVLLFPPGEAHKMMVLDDMEIGEKSIKASGTQLKGEVKKRLCVPPMNLPTSLYWWNGTSWESITDPSTLLALMQGEVYEGYAFPTAPFQGMVYLDMTALASVYNWESGTQTGEIWLDLGVAQKRSQYKNFGWDRFIGSAESAMKHYARNNLTEPEDAKRALPELLLAPNKDRGLVLPWQARFDKLDSLLQKIGEATGMGWDIQADFEHKRFVFDVQEGRDLSTGAWLATIATDRGNAENVTLKLARSNSCTTCYVGGAGQDAERLILSVGNEREGANRREMWTEGGSVSDPDMLMLAGENKLSEASEKRTLTAKLLDTGASRYERDWDVGDVVLLKHRNGLQATRVLSVKESYACDSVRQLDATFGASPVTLTGRIKQLQEQPVR